MSDRRIAAARRLLEAAASALDVPVAVKLWDGSRVSLSASAPPALEIELASAAVLGALLRRPGLETVVRHWAGGGIELHGGDPLALVDALRARRRRVSSRAVPRLALVRDALPLLATFGAAPAALPSADRPRRGDPDAVRFHYDLATEFYALFLDPEMQYSCGYYRDFGDALETAQRDKLDVTCRKLRLASGERLLDVGCGWGGLVCHAARVYGVDAVGVTLSREQHRYARRKVEALGLEKQVDVRLCDYRDLDPARDGRFDKIASVGMIEHVGIARYPLYFARLAALLRDRGLLLNHGITRGAKRTARAFRRRRPEKRWMLRHVFPGHELDHLGHTLAVMEAHGFEIRDVEDWREHYALTARHWLARLAAREREAEALVGRARTRIWLAYLAGVSTAFADGSLRIYQTLASRHGAKGPSELPPTRADLYV